MGDHDSKKEKAEMFNLRHQRKKQPKLSGEEEEEKEMLPRSMLQRWKKLPYSEWTETGEDIFKIQIL